MDFETNSEYFKLRQFQLCLKMERRYPARSSRNIGPERLGNPVHPDAIHSDIDRNAARSALQVDVQAYMDTISRNRDKATDLMARRGSRRVLTNCLTRIERALNDINALRSRVESLLDFNFFTNYQKIIVQLEAGVEQIVDDIHSHLEDREDDTITVSEVDSLASNYRLTTDDQQQPPPPPDVQHQQPPAEEVQRAPTAQRQHATHDDRQRRVNGQREVNDDARSNVTPHGNPPDPPPNTPATFSDAGDLVASLTGALERIACQSELPSAPVQLFDGSPIDYTRFIQDFRARVDDKPFPEAIKFAQLLLATTGKAKQAVELFRGTDAGYSRALVTLKERFGQPAQIVNAHVERVRNTKRLVGHEVSRLQEFADQLKASRDAFSELGYATEADAQMNLKAVFDKLPARIQARWAEKCQDIEAAGRRPTFSQMTDFIISQAKKSNHPIFAIQRDSRQDGADNQRRQRRNGSGSDLTLATRDGSNQPGRQGGGRGQPSQQRGGRGGYRRQAGSQNDDGERRQGQTVCDWCGRDHLLADCPRFAERTPEQRRLFVMDRRLCYCCFGTHQVRLCRRRAQCPVENCYGFHHRLIHTERPPPRPRDPPADGARRRPEDVDNVGDRTDANGSEDPGSRPPVTENSSCTQMSTCGPRVHLRVVPVAVSADGVGWVTTYGLLDSGSTCTMLTRPIARLAAITAYEEKPITISTVTSTTTKLTSLAACKIKSVWNGSAHFDVSRAHITERLGIDSIFAPRSEQHRNREHLDGLIADFKVDLPEVTVLVGEDVPMAHQILETRYGLDPDNEPYGVRTPFGWTIAGPAERVLLATEERLERLVEQWWSEEKHGFHSDDGRTLSIDDKTALKIMEETTTVAEGHYCVGMLWRDAVPKLNNNLPQAMKRLHHLKRKFDADPEYAEMYTTAMQGLIDKDYMRRVSRSEETETSPNTWYLPHHGVTNPNKPGKVRPVKDAAATYLGTSLNKALLHGPDLTNSIVGVLTRFRTGAIALVGDIAEMFMQVKVPHADQDALRVLWWGEGVDRPPLTYKMTRHVFGAADSPCVCSYVLRRCATDNKDSFSETAVRTVLENFYVDDLLCTAPDSDSAILLAEELQSLLARAGFTLTKFISNAPEVLEALPEADRATRAVEIAAKDEPQRALGVVWLLEPDAFGVKITDQLTEPDKDHPLTRRKCVSTVCSIYDPIGMCGPGTLPAKRILQEACRLELKWDDPLTEELVVSWTEWQKELPCLRQVQIPRSFIHGIGSWDAVKNVQLHHFSDASEVGYGTVSYLRITPSDGTPIRTHFLFAKSRCAPKRFVSVPRLELQAATVAARVDRLLRRELRLPINIANTNFWTDSTVVLGYIRNRDRRFKTYVANRLEEIHDSSEASQWRHCPTTQNPADYASRGVRPTKFVKMSQWIEGPAFLRLPESEWPQDVSTEVDQTSPEIKTERPILSAVETPSMEQFILRYSTFSRLLRHTAYIQRFIRYLRDKVDKSKTDQTPLTIHDLRRATEAIVRVVQRLSFPDGERTPCLLPLRPYRDDDGLLRVGGRLTAATHLPYEARHPTILPKSGHFTTLVIRHYHTTAAHCGQAQTLAELRRKYWVLHAKSTIRQLLHKCVTCRKIKGDMMTQIMSDLPKSRTEPYRPAFTVTGMDAFGPMMAKRGRRAVKRYGIIFTCFSTRAIHLELIEDMSTDSALNAIRRFIARRGTPEEIYADNGGNFIGTSRELRTAIKQWNELKPRLTQNGITFKFQTPYASHMSGVWERLIKTTKQALQAALTNNIVAEDVLHTILTEVEGFVNARPIVPASIDPDDFEALTPAHFLVGRNHIALPPGEFHGHDTLSRRWRATQAYTNDVWKRWIRDYLPSLTRRSKWLRRTRSCKVGDLVLVSDPTYSRGHWPMARVTRLFPSEDGLIRSVEVKTATGLLKRPIHKLCLLEAAD